VQVSLSPSEPGRATVTYKPEAGWLERQLREGAQPLQFLLQYEVTPCSTIRQINSPVILCFNAHPTILYSNPFTLSLFNPKLSDNVFAITKL
jgi:hypothetical protein